MIPDPTPTLTFIKMDALTGPAAPFVLSGFALLAFLIIAGVLALALISYISQSIA